MTNIAKIAAAEALTQTRHIFVRDLAIAASVGIHPHEKQATQTIIVHIDAEIALPSAGDGTQALADTVCYEAVTNKIRDIAGAGHIDLIETLAERIAARLFADMRILDLKVRIEKPEAIADTSAVGVELRWQRA